MAFLLHHLLSESAARFPDRNAVACRDETITYQELEQISNKLASTLVEIGLRRGERVGIYMAKSISSIISIFGILKAGGTYVPIPPDTPAKRTEYIIRNCGIKHLLSVSDKIAQIEDAFPENCPLEKILLLDSGYPATNLPLEFITRDTILKSSENYLPLSHSIDRDLAFILYTSGSTGDPKGVMTSHLNAMTFINWAQEFFRIQEEDRVANHSPLHFNLSIFDIFTTIKAGATVVIIPDGTAAFPIKLAELIDKEGITIWYSVPSILILLITYGKLERFKFESMRLILFAGEVFPIKYLRQVKKHFINAELYHQYGQTEAYPSTYYHVKDLPDDDSGRIPIGKPVPNFDIFAIDEKSNIINQPGEVGELYVNGSSVAQGYWGDTERTNSAFVDNPLNNGSRNKVFKTGDLATIDKDGNFVFISRKDNMVKSRGYRVELGEIEAVISSHPEVKEIAVVAIPDELIGNSIKAFLVPFEENKLKANDIARHCAERLPKYMIPDIEFLKSLPRTSTGKIDKKILKSNQIAAVSS